MSYEPTLIINKDQLNKKAHDLENASIEHPDDKAVQYVHKLLIEKGTKFMGINVILDKPELTSFNKEVRDTLYTFDIEYAEFN